MALFCFSVSCALVGVLFMAPESGFRPYYSASLFSILCFMFALKSLTAAYCINLTRFLAAAALGAALTLTPWYLQAFISLNKQFKDREALLAQFKNNKAEIAFLPYYLVPRGPSQNLSVIYFDPVNVKSSYEYYGIRVFPIVTAPGLQVPGAEESALF
jgi:hypothetical protein